jgi:hypothetical protein
LDTLQATVIGIRATRIESGNSGWPLACNSEKQSGSPPQAETLACQLHKKIPMAQECHRNLFGQRRVYVIQEAVAMVSSDKTMDFQVERSEFDAESGFFYYVSFKPDLSIAGEEISAQMTVQAVVWLSETSNLAEFAFEVPKQCRNSEALKFVCKKGAASYTEPRVFVALPGSSGEAAVDLPATLDLDFAGRIVGMEIQWVPEQMQPVPSPHMWA